VASHSSTTGAIIDHLWNPFIAARLMGKVAEVVL
jgi:hypothetical protein